MLWLLFDLLFRSPQVAVCHISRRLWGNPRVSLDRTMLYRCLAFFFLIPASFFVFSSLREWGKALCRGISPFLSAVAASAPEQVGRPASFFMKVFVAWPMHVGLGIFSDESLTTTLRRIARRIKRRIILILISSENVQALIQEDTPQVEEEPPQPEESAVLEEEHDPQPEDTPTPQEEVAPASRPDYCRQPVPFFSFARMAAMIQDPAISVVSFAVFDTLLVRPALHPKDIFHLIARKVDNQYGIDFIALRWDAEERLGAPHATLHDIYAFIESEHSLPHQMAQALLAEELHCEETLLAPRADVARLFAEAERLGKRIIAVADTYLPGEVLEGILRQKGYAGIAAVYTSCDHTAGTRDGELYERIIATENVAPPEILHIGGNSGSDYGQALEKAITSVYCPSPRELCLRDGAMYDALFGEGVRTDPFWSILWGYSLIVLGTGEAPPPGKIANMQDLRHFSLMTLAPMLTGFCLALAGDTAIREKYHRLYFSSHGGYLARRVYAVVSRSVPCLPGVFVYCAADPRAYEAVLPDADGVGDSSLASHTGAEAGARRRHTHMCAYYSRVFGCGHSFAGEDKRHLLLGLGPVEFVGEALAELTGKTVDTLHLWEKTADREGAASLDPEDIDWANLMCDALFSPCDEETVAFGDTQPVTAQAQCSEAHRDDCAAVHAACLEFATGFCAALGDYAPHMTVRQPDVAIDLCRTLLAEAPFCNLRLFRNIIMRTPAPSGAPRSLAKALERLFPQEEVFAGTGFDNPANVFSSSLRLRDAFGGTIGVHLHLYHLPLADELLRYFQDFPVPFDLYVTITDEAFARTARNVFTRASMPLVRSVTVLPVPNRGRDVAPWVLGMRPYQDDYDLFCHVHSKMSAHMGFGDNWRRYLYDNLLRADSVTDILGIFREEPLMGCLFPAAYPDVREVMVVTGIHKGTQLYGSEHEYERICGMMERMGFWGELRRSDLFFPVGTMLWYRPAALRQLFTCDLRLEEFAEEPIGVGGTLAHAIERLPALVAAHNGYRARSFTKYH